MLNFFWHALGFSCRGVRSRIGISLPFSTRRRDPHQPCTNLHAEARGELEECGRGPFLGETPHHRHCDPPVVRAPKASLLLNSPSPGPTYLCRSRQVPKKNSATACTKKLVVRGRLRATSLACDLRHQHGAQQVLLPASDTNTAADARSVLSLLPRRWRILHSPSFAFAAPLLSTANWPSRDNLRKTKLWPAFGSPGIERHQQRTPSSSSEAAHQESTASPPTVKPSNQILEPARRPKSTKHG